MKKVMITDDAEFMRNILKKIFTEAGYQVIGEAENADQGIQMYKELKPDLITMDIMMPDKSGLEAIKEILKEDREAKIVVVSSLGQELLVMEALEMGAKDFLVKPFKKEKFLKVIEGILNQ